VSNESVKMLTARQKGKWSQFLSGWETYVISSVQMQRTYIVVLDPPFTSYTKVRFCIILSGENSVSIGEIILLVCILKLKLLGVLAASSVVVSVRGPSMSFYPDFIQILFSKNQDKIWLKSG
jgi:hypothetical protein